MVTDLQSSSDQHQKMQKDMLDMLRGDIPPPSRVAGVMYNMGYYVSVIEPQLHTEFLEALMVICKDFEQRSNTIRERVSFYTTSYCKCLRDFILLLQMFTW